MPSFRRRVTRLAFSTVSRVSPKLAGGLAFRLFCRTPPKQPRAAKAKEAYESGRVLLARAGAQPIAVRGPNGIVQVHRLPGSGAEKRRVLVLHGWGSRSEYLARLAIEINSSGAEVVMVDLPGHGGSAGRMLHLRLAVEAIADVDRELGPFDAAVAHSFGGATLMVAAGGVFPGVPKLKLRRLALVGAPTEIETLFAQVTRELRLTPAAGADLVRRAEVIAGVPLKALDAIPIARELDIPLLVVHAEDDKEVSAKHARRYEGTSPHLRFHWANGFGHRRIVSAPSVVAHVSSFLLEEETLAA